MKIEELMEALRIARALPNPSMTFETDSSAAIIARSWGAVTRVNRYGFGGDWVGHDYMDSSGNVIMESMAAFPAR